MSSIPISRSRTRLGLALLLAVHFFSFYGAKVINLGRTHHQLATAADRALPFWPVFVVIYVLAFLQWFFCYFYLYRRHPDVFCRVAWSSVLAETAAFLLFLLYPTMIDRPEVTGGGVIGWLLNFIYQSDTPVNCFPSLHCLQSWMCWRGLHLASGPKAWYDKINLVFSLLVCASTVLIRQHFLLDIPGGILLAELGLLLTGIHFRPAKG